MDMLINNRSGEVFIWDGILREVIFECLEQESMPDNCELSVSIVTNGEIKSLNKRYRNIDSVTDVLSFPLGDDEDGQIILGDIIISLDKAREQAVEYGHSLERELAFLAVHGTLHLIGYDHMTIEDEAIMVAKQEDILNRAGYIR